MLMFSPRRKLGSLIYPIIPQITWKLFPQIIRLDVRGNINKTHRPSTGLPDGWLKCPRLQSTWPPITLTGDRQSGPCGGGYVPMSTVLKGRELLLLNWTTVQLLPKSAHSRDVKGSESKQYFCLSMINLTLSQYCACWGKKKRESPWWGRTYDPPVLTGYSETDASAKGTAAVRISSSCWAPAIFRCVTRSQTGIQEKKYKFSF